MSFSTKKGNELRNLTKLSDRSQDIYSSPTRKNYNNQMSKGQNSSYMSPKYKIEVTITDLMFKVLDFHLLLDLFRIEHWVCFLNNSKINKIITRFTNWS